MNDRTYNTTSDDKILSLLSSLKRRAQILAALRGIFFLFAGFIFFATVFIGAMGWWGGSFLRILGWVSLFLSTTGSIYFFLYRPLKNLTSLESVAQKIGKVYTEKASDVLSACQFALSNSRQHFSPFLVHQHILKSISFLSAINKSKIFPSTILILPVSALFFALGIAVTFKTTAPGLLAVGLNTTWQEPHVLKQDAKQLTIASPVVGDLVVTLRYPEYLKRKEKQLSATSGSLVAPYGTTILLKGSSLIRNVQKGLIRLPGNTTRPLTIDKTGQVNGWFVVSAQGPFSLVVGNDRLMTEGPKRNMEIEVDEGPSIRLLRPTSDVEVDKNGEILLEYEALDNCGLNRIDLVIKTPKGVEITKTISRPAQGDTHVRSKYRWTPGSLRIGDEPTLSLELVAFDNDTIKGPKQSNSRSLNVTVLTKLSRHKQAMAEQERTLDSLIDLLATRLSSPTPMSPKKARAAKKRFSLVRAQTEDSLSKLTKLTRKLNQDAITQNIIKETFIRIRESLSNQLQFESRLYRFPLASGKKRRSVDKVTVRILESAIIRIDALILDQQFSGLVMNGSTLEQYQRKLTELLKSFANNRSESARRAVIESISALEKEIAALRLHLEKVRGQVGDTYLNPSTVRIVDLTGSLTRLKELLANDDLAGAVALVDKLKQQLSRLMAGLESSHLAFKADRFGEGERFIGKLMDKLMALESEQLQLKRLTVALGRIYQEKLLNIMRGQIDTLVQEQIKQVTLIRNKLDSLPAARNLFKKELIQQTQMGAKELNLALGQGDLDESMHITTEMLDTINELPDNFKDDTSNELRAIGQTIELLSKKIKDAYPKPSKLFGQKDRSNIRNQAAKQRHIMAQTKKFRTWINSQKEDVKFLTQQAIESLGQAIEQMNHSVGALEQHQVRESIEHQASALDVLARLRQDLRRGSETKPIDYRPIVLPGKVEIPTPEEYEVPKAYKEDILEAMRGNLPNHFKEAIKKYYETLVH